MPRTIRFHLDEHCDPAIAAGLRSRGIDVATPLDVGLLSAPDEAHLAYARREGRVIFTRDADFLRLHAAGAEHAGLIYSHQQGRGLGEIVRGLEMVWEILDPEEMRNRLEFF